MMLLFCASIALAAAPTWTTSGDIRFVGTVPPILALDPDGGTLTQGPVLDQRFRLGGALAWPTWKLVGEADLFTGQVLGDTWNIDGDTDERGREAIDAISPDGFALRRGYVSGRLGPVDVAMGAQTSSWGLGMVANDGTTPRLFGRNDFGDRVLRLRVATRPGQARADATRSGSVAGAPTPLTLVAAVDRVIADDSARWSQDQAAYQAVFAGLWTDGRARRGGLYLVGRHQTEHASSAEIDQRVTKVFVADAFADLSRSVGDAGGKVRLAGEGAFIVGSTDRSQSYASPDGLRVRAGGVALLTAFTPDEGTTTLHLRGGWASGDGDPDDDTTHTFTFDRDYAVGMVLFPEVKGAIEAATYARIEDPANAGQAPEGAEQTVTEGAFGGATYLQPAISWRPMKLVELRTGAILAWSNAVVGSPFETTRNGGVPTNHLGDPTSGHYLGSEWDWAVECGRQNRPAGAPPNALILRPTISVLGGHALLSEDLGGGRADLVMVRGKLTW